MNSELSVILMAYVLDLILGDPRWLPHPVRGIGWLAVRAETLFRRAVKSELAGGALFALTIVSIGWGAAFILIYSASSFNRYLGLTLSAFFIYTSLAVKDLKVESMRVAKALEKGDISLARKNLGLIVGRDTKDLDDKEIIRATVETVSENIVDGIIAPLFYAFLGGAPLALAYKAINTLDSMVGYKNEKYRYFGRASARIDDVVNFIPARISAAILPIAALFAGRSIVGSLRVAWRDGRKNPSPNSGIPEAAVAGALGVRLGGLNFYNSVAVEKSLVGDGKNALSIMHIKESVRIAYISSGLFIAVGTFFIWVTGRG